MRVIFVVLCLAMPAPVLADMGKARAAFETRKFEEARRILEPLSRAGNAEAELLLGDLYGIPGLLGQDPARAVEYWHRAAQKAHPLAQLRLARSLRDGFGLPADPVRAALWARLADIGGAPGARDLAQDTEHALNAAQRTDLETLVQDYKPFFYPLAP